MRSLFRPPDTAVALAVFLVVEWWVTRHVPGLAFALLAATALLKKQYAQGAQLCITVLALYFLLNRR
ncbi:hypothetical protein [Streptacidiphilus neutrinimicus]|uniref:hypothetical protein n=1 Tax=Streptacidiphilus neutrinimicus TaxID=105420 RepID=UPI0005A5FB0B|nr:hypothetical protein [Streptacidiphilus neutrinimicus]